MTTWKDYQPPSRKEMDRLRAQDAEVRRETMLLEAATTIEMALRAGVIGRSPWMRPSDALSLAERFEEHGWRVEYETRGDTQRVCVDDPRFSRL